MFVLIFIFGLFGGGEEKTADLRVVMEDFQSEKGKALVAIYNKADDFPDGERYREGVATISGNTAEYVFEDLPVGKYAIAVFHDKNENYQLDKNLVGIPTESYGFSKDAPATFSAPSFDDAAIKLESDRKILIHLR